MTLAAMKMTDQTRKAEHFRALHIPGTPLLLFNIWDAGSAKAVAAAGAKAIATSSWSVANANGFADGERMPLAVRAGIDGELVRLDQLGPILLDYRTGSHGFRPLLGRLKTTAAVAG